MRAGKNYKCQNCGKQYEVFTGIGYSFPSDYQELVADMKKGRYGTEIKQLLAGNPNLAVDAERFYYECEECGYWSVEECKDIYEHKNSNASSENSYVMGYELRQDYRLIQKYDHVCPKCRGHMKKRDVRNVTCPECGKKNKPLEYVMWD